MFFSKHGNMDWLIIMIFISCFRIDRFSLVQHMPSRNILKCIRHHQQVRFRQTWQREGDSILQNHVKISFFLENNTFCCGRSHCKFFLHTLSPRHILKQHRFHWILRFKLCYHPTHVICHQERQALHHAVLALLEHIQAFQVSSGTYLKFLFICHICTNVCTSLSL